MNLKEYLFYTNTSINDIAQMTAFHRNYVTRVIKGELRPSKKFVNAVENITKGKVNESTIVGPFSHPDFISIT